MSSVAIVGPQLGNALQNLLLAPDIMPGDAPSYQTCKVILTFHPLGGKMAEAPIKMAQSQSRIIEIPDAPDEVKKAFVTEWMRLNATRHIRNVKKLSRAYGISSIALLEPGADLGKPPDMATLYKQKISFNVLDPLNTAGSLVLNQDPNALDFQKHGDIRVNGTVYHRARVQVVLNGDPIYIEYTSSAFGFVGRSVYQSVLYPLKTFVNTLITDDLVIRKAGVFIAMLKQVSSAFDQVTSKLFGYKRQILKDSQTDNVISIGETEKIESLNMQNLEGPYKLARENCLKNIATGADMPASWLNNETLASGFAEGSEDANKEARCVDDLREEMQPLYDWMDAIVRARAWNPDFYKTIQALYPEQYSGMEFEQAFYTWSQSFTAAWPSLLIEPDSERAKADKVRLEALIEAVGVMLPALDPDNKARLIEWLAENMNSMKLLFPTPLDIDIDALLAYVPPDILGPGEAADVDADAEPKPKLRAVAN